MCTSCLSAALSDYFHKQQQVKLMLIQIPNQTSQDIMKCAMQMMKHGRYNLLCPEESRKPSYVQMYAAYLHLFFNDSQPFKKHITQLSLTAEH